MTPLIAELHNAHKERLARFARAAVTDRHPIVRQPRPVAVETPIIDTDEKPKPWFHIVAEVNEIETLEGVFPIAAIQRATCRYFGLTRQELLSRRRDHKIMLPRQIAIYLSKILTLRSLPEIGRRFGGYDHSTILHNVRITEERMRSDWLLAFDIAHIEGMLA